jgi:hypothetical protein
MLIVSILSSLGLLSIFAVPLIRGKKPQWPYPLLGALCIGVPLCILPCVAMQFVLLMCLFAADKYWVFTRHTYLTLACVCTAVVYVGMGWTMSRHLASLRHEFPYESMEARLPQPRRAGAPRTKPASEADLTSLEDVLGRRSGWLREDTLNTLHEKTVQAFILSSGFGFSRMLPMEHWVRYEVEQEKTLPQPSPKRQPTQSYRPDLPIPMAPRESELSTLHNESVLDFASPRAFGYFKDRRNVAGFRPHQFREVPKPGLAWKLEWLELVGLVIHEKPVAYVSDSLPRMDLLKQAKIRPLDSFEVVGLVQLRDGQALVAREEDNQLRLLGAIRATNQCIACHGCERGELLGAFSYVLRP